MRTYLFYDIETTGLNPAFDQILQFAAIRVNENLEEIERYDINITLRKDIIPSPYAFITHNIPIETENSICEYEAISKIHKIINKPNTISVGYNSLGFDDKFLRFSFYRNLFDPYSHQYAKGCSRMDILPFTVIYSLHNKDVINWGEKNADGKKSISLETLNQANNFTKKRAHNALVDVEITIELAKKFFAKKNIWNYVEGFFDKKTDTERVSNLPDFISVDNKKYKFGLLYSHKLGYKNSYQAPVLLIGNSIPYSNQILCLRLDNCELQKTTLKDIEKTTFVIRKKIGTAEIILFPKERFLSFIDKKRDDIVQKNKLWIKENPEIFKKIVEYYREYEYTEIPDIDIDAALYQTKFVTKKERGLCNEFHKAPINKKKIYIKNLKNKYLEALAFRILERNYPDEFQFEELKKTTGLDYKGEAKLLKIDALKDIKKIVRDEKLDEIQKVSIKNLEIYLKQK